MSTAVEAPPIEISEGKVFRGGLVVGAGLLAGQALGFIRQATIAYLLGTGPQADAVAVAFAPVDLWWAVLAAAMVFGFGPMLAASGPERPPEGFAKLGRLVVVVALAATAVSLVFARPIVMVLAPGLDPETAGAAARLLRVTALGMPAVAWSTLFTAVFYSQRRFLFPALQQAVVNCCTIVTALALASQHSALGFAAGYAAGAWLQLGLAYWIARRQRPPRSEPAPLTRLLAGPAHVLAYSALVGLNPIVTRALASTLGPGSTAAFDYCLKLVGVPLGLLVMPLSSSLLSEIAPFRLRSDRRAAFQAIGRAAVLTGLAATVIVLLMEALGPWVVGVLFERGRFGAASTSTVTPVLAGFFPVLAAWSVLDVLSRSLFSLGRPRRPIGAAALALVTNLLISGLVPVRSPHWIGLGAVVGFLAGASLVGLAFLPQRDRRGAP